MLSFFFFNDTATTEIYTLSLHDALPISCGDSDNGRGSSRRACARATSRRRRNANSSSDDWDVSASYPWRARDRKSTRLNSSHLVISYAVFCLKKKKYRAQSYSDALQVAP